MRTEKITSVSVLNGLKDSNSADGLKGSDVCAYYVFCPALLQAPVCDSLCTTALYPFHSRRSISRPACRCSVDIEYRRSLSSLSGLRASSVSFHIFSFSPRGRVWLNPPSQRISNNGPCGAVCGAPSGNRTRIRGLEGRCSAIELLRQMWETGCANRSPSREGGPCSPEEIPPSPGDGCARRIRTFDRRLMRPTS